MLLMLSNESYVLPRLNIFRITDDLNYECSRWMNIEMYRDGYRTYRRTPVYGMYGLDKDVRRKNTCFSLFPESKSIGTNYPPKFAFFPYGSNLKSIPPKLWVICKSNKQHCLDNNIMKGWIMLTKIYLLGKYPTAFSSFFLLKYQTQRNVTI